MVGSSSNSNGTAAAKIRSPVSGFSPTQVDGVSKVAFTSSNWSIVPCGENPLEDINTSPDGETICISACDILNSCIIFGMEYCKLKGDKSIKRVAKLAAFLAYDVIISSVFL